MGLTIRLQTEQGEKLEEMYDSNNRLQQLLPSHDDTSFQCLRFIDWYGDTTFNILQMKSLLIDLERISKTAVASEDKILLKHIKQLAEKCSAGTHLYLKFIGD